MLVTGFSAGPWGTNCWIAAEQPGAECLIVDPGFDALPEITRIVAEHKLRPVAILVTHGHMDHMWSVTPVADGYGIPAVISRADRELLAHPERAVSAAAKEMIAALGGKFVEPSAVQVLEGDVNLELAGFPILAQLAPGHTPGSTVFTIQRDEPRMFSGDLLFRGSIGRTDLPGGDSRAMGKSLAKVLTSAARETLVHCGHGDDTTIDHELRTNPYLRDLEGIGNV